MYVTLFKISPNDFKYLLTNLYTSILKDETNILSDNKKKIEMDRPQKLIRLRPQNYKR